MSSLPSFGEHSGCVASAIVPAYREGERIHRVLDVLTAYPYFCEVIVVADDPTGRTAAVVQRYPGVRYVQQPPNQGKGQAVDLGVRYTTSNVLFLCDADVIGLTHEDITAILTPVVEGREDLSVAVRGRRASLLTELFARLFPLATLVGGERAFAKRLWQELPPAYKVGYRIELGLNVRAAHYGRGLAWRVFPHLRQTVKEQKYGITVGIQRRWQELTDIAFTLSTLRMIGGKVRHEQP
ncbi:MAG: family 2 glycosyl transferase [Parcubacteria group bacterium Gr01-1014_38]|nr:MAG: family 2 glycosyl transferase [Parcubacteria group bacterium Gr01-1014_38]